MINRIAVLLILLLPVPAMAQSVLYELNPGDVLEIVREDQRGVGAELRFACGCHQGSECDQRAERASPD